MNLFHLVYTLFEAFFSAVAFCGIMSVLYNRNVAGLRESYLKKAGSLSILPLSFLAGAGHLFAVYTGLPTTSLPAILGIIFTANTFFVWKKQRRLNRDNVTKPMRLRRDGLAYENFFLPIRLFLLSIRWFNRAGRPEWLLKDVRLQNLHPEFEGYRIAFLTDFHVHPTHSEDYYREIVEQTLAQKPDVIFVGGDFVSRTWNCAKSERVLREIANHPAVYMIRGNHDFWSRPSYFARVARKWGAKLLINEWTVIEKGEGKLALLGVEDPYVPMTPRRMKKLKDQLRDMRLETDQLAAIGLVHNPDLYKLPKQAGCQFALAGHTHGGQIRLPFYGATIKASSVSQQFVSGSGDFRGMETLTSNGLGCFFPVRILCPPQVVIVTLRTRRKNISVFD